MLFAIASLASASEPPSTYVYTRARVLYANYSADAAFLPPSTGAPTPTPT